MKLITQSADVACKWLSDVIQDGQYVITVKPHTMTRSDAQNRLLWLWNGEIQKHMADTHGIHATADGWHETMVNRLRPPEYKGDLDGEPVLERWRTSKASVAEMTEYLNELNAYCQQSIGLLLPIPDDLRLAIYGQRR